jgi:hypothetical protein
MMTPEQLEGIQADVEDAEKRAGRIATWRAMPHRFAVESGLRTQRLRAPRLAAHLRDLLAEVTGTPTLTDAARHLRAARAILHGLDAERIDTPLAWATVALEDILTHLEVSA